MNSVKYSIPSSFQPRQTNWKCDLCILLKVQVWFVCKQLRIQGQRTQSVVVLRKQWAKRPLGLLNVNQIELDNGNLPRRIMLQFLKHSVASPIAANTRELNQFPFRHLIDKPVDT